MAPIRKLKSIPELASIVCFSFIFGTIASVSYLVRLVTKGPRRMFYQKNRNVRPAILSNQEFGEHGFLMLKNSRMKIHYVINGPKEKPLMLFLHGFPEFWYSWRFQLKEFQNEYRVCAVDMRGYGESDKPPQVSEYHSDDLTNDVREIITGLGYKSCTLMAHDWGGAVAWMFCIRWPEMVNRLIIGNCPHPAAFQKVLNSSMKQMLMSWYMFFFQLPVIPLLEIRSDDLHGIGAAFVGKSMGAKKGAFTDEDIECYKYNLAEYHDLLGPINYYRAMMRYERPDWMKNLRGHKIQVPTLMVWGTNDGALSKQMAEVTGEFVEDYTVNYIEGCSHWVQQEEPKAFNDHVWEFLKRRQ